MKTELENRNTLVIFTDGSCNPNPGGDMGAAMIAYRALNFGVVKRNTRDIKSKYDNIETISQRFHKWKKGSVKKASNNVAEHLGINMALSYIKENERSQMFNNCIIFSDSELAVRQMSGIYKVNQKALCYDIALENRKILEDISIKIDFIWIPRELNTRTDALSKY